MNEQPKENRIDGSDALAMVGALLFVGGIALWSIPAAMVVSGLGLMSLAWMKSVMQAAAVKQTIKEE